MKSNDSRVRTEGLTLVEMLCVIAIIGILAAILLPALNKVKARALRTQCAHNLQQAGVAFHEFAHDHNSQFPMAVPASAGGSLEYVQTGSHVTGDFYFGFRHFQTLSNELVTPKGLVCPADKNRHPALDFPSLNNDNLSYFVGVNAEFSSPGSVLAGDRNITNDWISAGSSMLLGPNHALRWTDELHFFKGNLLFADAHVEQPNTPGLVAGRNGAHGTAVLVVPSARPIGIASVPGHPGGGGGGGSYNPPITPSSQGTDAGSPQPTATSATQPTPAAVAPSQAGLGSSPHGTYSSSQSTISGRSSGEPPASPDSTNAKPPKPAPVKPQTVSEPKAGLSNNEVAIIGTGAFPPFHRGLPYLFSLILLVILLLLALLAMMALRRRFRLAMSRRYREKHDVSTPNQADGGDDDD